MQWQCMLLFRCRFVSVVATGKKKSTMCGNRVLRKILNSFAVIFVSIKTVSLTSNPSFDNFLFGDGRFKDNPEDDVRNILMILVLSFTGLFFILKHLHEKDTTRHKSSSIEDLMTLFETEKYLVQTLKNSYSLFDGQSTLQEVIQNYLSSVDYDE